MATICALFSGQGSQYAGMGKELCENFPKARLLYECAGDIFGFDVAKLSFEWEPEQLSQTLVAQPLIYTHSLACLEAAREVMERPDAVAGHSLGEFAALACAGAYSAEDGMRIVKERASAMDAASRQVDGAMYAVVGSTEEAVRAACDQAEGFVLPVNFNLPGQTVISGGSAAAAAAAALLEDRGAKVVRLAVSSAFHTSLMESAARQLEEAAASFAYAPLETAFYSNLTGDRLEFTPGEYPGYFARHMMSPVRFVEQTAAMARDGVEVCVEFGPKKTVSTLAKKNVRAFSVCNIEDLKSLEKAKKVLA